MSEEEPDLLAPDTAAPRLHPEQASPAEEEQEAEGGSSEPDLASEADLKVLLAQLNPLAIRDVTTIEKGVEHFFLFHQAHLALTRPDQLKFLSPEDLENLEERGAVVRFGYIRYQEGPMLPAYVPVLIRPASLKGEQVSKVRMGCVRGSAGALLEYLHGRDARIQQLEQDGELSRWVSDQLPKQTPEGRALRPEVRADLNRLLEGLRSLSFEHFLESEIQPPEELLIGVLRILSLPAQELQAELALVPETSERARATVESRGGRPVLLRLTPDFHIVHPPALQLVEVEDDQSRNVTSEAEWVMLLFVQLARKLLLSILPEEESAWIQKAGTSQAAKFLEELHKHPSLTGEDWPAVPDFLRAYESLLKHVRGLEQVRSEYVLGQVVEQTRSSLNMQFEPVHFSPETLQIPPSVSEKFSREEIFQIVCDRIKSGGDVLVMEERRGRGERTAEGGGIFLLHAANLPQAFIRNRKRRNFLHLLARNNGRETGVYSFLREVTDRDFPREIVDEQISLSRAIREWEDEQEKERLKRELAAMGFFQRLWLFFLGLFGVSPKRRQDDAPRRAEAAGRSRESKARKGATGVLVGPREKQKRIPVKVQKAIDYVIRKNRGIIWLDEVLGALDSTRYSLDGIGDMLYYDELDRYEEARALLNERRVFLPREKLEDPAWIEATLDYLENVARPGPEHGLLSRYLETRAGELES